MSVRKKLIITTVITAVIPAVLIILLSALLFGVFFLVPPGQSTDVFAEYAIKLIAIWAVASLAVSSGTAICVNFYLGRSVLVPLSKISIALEHLKGGDLNYEFPWSADKELREICVSFEELRLRLQRNVRMNVKKENDRRMLIANISHDIKTPITSIKGYIEGIRDGIADSEEKRIHYLNVVYAKAVAIEQMAENLSVYSKLELDRMCYNKEATDVFGFLIDCAEEFEADLHNADMDFEIDLPDEHITAALDKEKMKRVYTNIVTNATKYKKSGRGSLKITAEATDESVAISFKDAGKGIAEADLPLIFDEFYRADLSRNTTIEGSGLGLSVCKKIVADHGGKIWARSKLGEGCEILIFLPKSVLRKDENNEDTDN